MTETIRGDHRFWAAIVLLGLVAGVFGAVAPSYVSRYHLPFHSAAGIYCGFLLMLILVVTPGVRGMRLPGRYRAALLMVLWCLPYLAYAAGTRDFRWMALARLVGVAAPMLLVYSLFPVRDPARFAWQDFAISAWLIWVLLSHQLADIWSVPANLDFMGRLYLVVIAAWTWVFIRPVPELGYEFWFSIRTLRVAGVNFALFAVIAIPLSLAMHFTQWNPRSRVFPAFFVDFIEIFLFVALLEELFFRGFLQTLVSKSLKSSLAGRVIISCLFGLFHILHAPFPNWKYVLLATVAGWFYGTAFIKAGNLMAPALTHAMVDTAWRTFFMKG